MKIEKAVKEYLIEIKIRKYTDRTQKSYRNNLRTFCTFLGEDYEVEDLSLGDVKLFTKDMVSSGKKATYINSILKCVKSFVQYCYEEGYGGFNTKKNFKWCKEEKVVIETFKPEDVKLMLQNCKGTHFLDVRDKAIITMFFETGIRNLELCGIRDEDIHENYILIHGKNHKERVVPITDILQKQLIKYQAAKESYFIHKDVENYFFLSFTGRKLTVEGNEHIFKKRGVGITGVRVSPHTARHFFAQSQVKLGTDLFTISRLLGHENIQITQTYLNSLRDDDVIEIAKRKSVLGNL